MIIYSKVTSAPASEPVTLAEAKAQLKVDHSDEDDLITSLIIAAREISEAYSGRSFISQTRTVTMDRFPYCRTKEIILPYGPVTAVTSFTYLDTNGLSQSLTGGGTDYTADSNGEIYRMKHIDQWPDTQEDRLNTVTIVYTAGYTTLPTVVKQAILQQVASMYENRSDEQGYQSYEINWTSKRLLDTIKVDHSAYQN